MSNSSSHLAGRPFQEVAQRLHAAAPDLVWGIKCGVLVGAAVLVLGLPPNAGGARARYLPTTTLTTQQVQLPARGVDPAPIVERQADFSGYEPSPEARRVVDWVAASRDNHGMPFVILDKLGARVFVFDPAAHLSGTTLVLLGSATGDDSAPGIGDKPLSQINSDERTTPAGRFVSRPGHDSTGEDVVWVDYDTSVAMHRVKVVDPKEHRFERIATSSIEDKRISNGCVNVPIAFYDDVIMPALGHASGVVYVLPEVKSLEQVFAGMHNVVATETPRKTANL